MTLSFEVRHTEALSRLGRITTPHGTVDTPALLPVVNPNRPTVAPSELPSLGVQMIITNAYILWSGRDLSRRARDEGVHKLTGFPGPIMTDSGTFQSYVYGDVKVDPTEIVAFQREIGVDIATILDVFSTPDRTHEEAVRDVDVTLARARTSMSAAGDTALALTVQGGVHPDVRQLAAESMSALEPPGGAIHPIGGVVPLLENQRYATIAELVLAAKSTLHAGRPAHLFGAGHPHMFALAVYLGCDLFDSAAYAKFAVDGRLLHPWGTDELVDLTEFPLATPPLAGWTPKELQKTGTEERTRLLALHNLHATMAELARVREAQRKGRLFDLVLERAVGHPNLIEAIDVLARHADQLEAEEPQSYRRAMNIVPPFHRARPLTTRSRARIAASLAPRRALVLLPETRRPFTNNAQAAVASLVARGFTPCFPSRLGPVPYDVDDSYPFAQSVEPPLGASDVAACAAELGALAREVGVDVAPLEEALTASAGVAPDILADHVRGAARYQLGADAGSALLAGDLRLEVSPRTGRVRRVIADEEHVASLRAHDGFLTLKLAGARRIHAAVSAPRLRLVGTADSAPFNAKGKSVIARFVRACDAELRPGDECLVVGPDDKLVATAQLVVSPREAWMLSAGVVAKLRRGVDEDDQEDPD